MICIGDSIATYQGLGGALHCSEIHATVGVPSSTVIREAESSGHDNVCVISAGSNDPLNLNLANNLEKIRNNVHCPIVIWVRPANSRASSVVAGVASAHGDRSVQIIPGSDGVHPRSYSQLASQITGHNVFYGHHKHSSYHHKHKRH